jgi:hypothetical protein
MSIREPVSVEVELRVARRDRRYVYGIRRELQRPTNLKKLIPLSEGRQSTANFPDQSYFGLNTPGKILIVFPRYEMS